MSIKGAKPCPFCGEEASLFFGRVDGYKWGAVLCGCGGQGPDVKTQYDESEDAPWHKDALKEWNERDEKTKTMEGYKK